MGDDIASVPTHAELLGLTDCAHCPLYNNGGGPVFGHGPPRADLVAVGEAPGWNEVEEGRPFAGRSGKLMDLTLADCGMDRSNVFVTNVTLCRPPPTADGKDTPPPPAAIRACSKRLHREVVSRSPRVVLAYGATAAQTLLGTSQNIGELVDATHWNDSFGTIVLPTYHPAAVLHGAEGYYEDIYATTQRAIGFATGSIPLPERTPRVRWKEVHDPARAFKWLRWLGNHYDELVIDLETDYTSHIRGNWLEAGIGPRNADWCVTFDAEAIVGDAEDLLKRMMDHPELTWWAHNESFEARQLMWHLGTRFRNLRDTMAYALGTTERLEAVSLKRQARKWRNAPLYEQELWKHGWKPPTERPMSTVPRAVRHKYLAHDVVFTGQLPDVLIPLCEKEGTRRVVEELLMPAQECFADLELRGVKIDTDLARRIETEWAPFVETSRSRLQEYAKDVGFDARDVVKDSRDGLLNPNSFPQKHHLAFNILKLPKHQGRKSTDKDWKWHVRSTLGNHPLVDMLDDWDMVTHMLNHYVKGIGTKHVWADGCVHPSILLGGTVTGRLAIHEPPLQTIPREELFEENPTEAGKFESIKRLFIPHPASMVVKFPFVGHLYDPDDEWVWIDADYSNLELHVAHHYTGDRGLGEALAAGGDFHRQVALRKLQMEGRFDRTYESITSSERYITKFITFGIAYGRSAWSLAQGELRGATGGSEALAQQYVNQHWEAFPQWKEWFDRVQWEALNLGRLVTTLGRVRRWNLITRDNEGHIRNQAVNFPIQSLASDTCLWAMIQLNRILPAQGLGFPLFPVHDSIGFEVPKKRLPEALSVIRSVMEHPPYETDAEFPVDFKVGPSWGDATKYKEAA